MIPIIPKNWNFKLKSYKQFEGHDGDGFNVALTYKGKAVATVFDAAYGGEYEYHWTDRDALKVMEEFVKSCPPYKYGSMEIETSMDFVVGEMIEIQDWAKRLKKLMKGTVFISGGKNYSSKSPDSEAVRANAIKQFPDAVILNGMDFQDALYLYLETLKEA